MRYIAKRILESLRQHIGNVQTGCSDSRGEPVSVRLMYMGITAFPDVVECVSYTAAAGTALGIATTILLSVFLIGAPQHGISSLLPSRYYYYNNRVREMYELASRAQEYAPWLALVMAILALASVFVTFAVWDAESFSKGVRQWYAPLRDLTTCQKCWAVLLVGGPGSWLLLEIARICAALETWSMVVVGLVVLSVEATVLLHAVGWPEEKWKQPVLGLAISGALFGGIMAVGLVLQAYEVQFDDWLHTGPWWPKALFFLALLLLCNLEELGQAAKKRRVLAYIATHPPAMKVLPVPTALPEAARDAPAPIEVVQDFDARTRPKSSRPVRQPRPQLCDEE